MLQLPPTVRIGFAEYKLVTMPAEEMAGADHYGITDNNDLTIRLDTEGADARICNTVLHEILHGCWDVGDLGEAEQEEKVVAVMANQLCQVIRDNSALFIRMIAALAPAPEPPRYDWTEVAFGPHGLYSRTVRADGTQGEFVPYQVVELSETYDKFKAQRPPHPNI